LQAKRVASLHIRFPKTGPLAAPIKIKLRKFVSQKLLFKFKLRKDGLKGQKAPSPGHRPGLMWCADNALQGQKHYLLRYSFALSGRIYSPPCTQGAALGYLLSGLSGRFDAGFSLLAKLEL
jgi:hypothetical protein